MSEPSIGRYGQVAFLAGSAIYINDRRIVQVGDSAPRGGLFSSLSFPAIDDTLAFRARVSDGPSLLDTYVVLENGHLREVVREGDMAPETGGETFSALYSNAVVNACGHIPFTAQISNGQRGVWIYQGVDSGYLMALQGEPSPAGGNYQSFFGYFADGAARMSLQDGGYRYFNESGVLVFRASLDNGDNGIFGASAPVLFCNFLFGDGFESGDTGAWQVSE